MLVKQYFCVMFFIDVKYVYHAFINMVGASCLVKYVVLEIGMRSR